MRAGRERRQHIPFLSYFASVPLPVDWNASSPRRKARAGDPPTSESIPSTPSICPIAPIRPIPPTRRPWAIQGVPPQSDAHGCTSEKANTRFAPTITRIRCRGESRIRPIPKTVVSGLEWPVPACPEHQEESGSAAEWKSRDAGENKILPPAGLHGIIPAAVVLLVLVELAQKQVSCP